MIAANFAAFGSAGGRFHRNIVTIPQMADSDDLNPYSMLTRAQAKRRSSDTRLSEAPPAMNAAAKNVKPFFINNCTLKSRNFGDTGTMMKQENMRQMRELNRGRTKVTTPTIIKSNPVFQYGPAENVSELVSGKTKTREEDMKQAILELAQLGEHYMGKRKAPKTKNRRTDGAVTKVPNLRALHKKTRTRHSGMATVKSPLSTKDVNNYIKQMNSVDIHY